MLCPLKERGDAGLPLDYCAGRLGAEAAGEMERHVEECPDCRALVGSQSAVWKALEEWRAAPVSADFDRSLFRKIDAEARDGWWNRLARRWLAGLPRPMLPAAAVCAVVLVAFLLQRPSVSTFPVETRADRVDVEQVESALDDLDMLRQLGPEARMEAETPRSL